MIDEKQAVSAAGMEGVRFDEDRFPDAMGWRAKFGVLTPAPNTIVENEMHEMAPPGVINVVNRYYVPNQEVRSDDDWRLITGCHQILLGHSSRSIAASSPVCFP